jgi:hypothetical protein
LAFGALVVAMDARSAAMTPTLFGRVQTRWLVMSTAGVAWTALVVPVLPRPAAMALGAMYAVAYGALLVVVALGTAWELVYHGMQQLRWDKDWPSLFSLLAGVPEGVVAWFVLRALGWSPPPVSYLVLFATTWLVGWLVMHGPLRIVSLRWRFQGARIG